ncbi:hypothetical protein CBS101457_001271 [Exobasidium rhododendri]|nr:hypothetical protein CBS101457_001271 [Exobasidium rhododendri]
MASPDHTFQPWRRILWTRQPFPDNYVPGDFLQRLQSGPSSRLPTFQDLVIYSLPMSQHLSTTLLFVGLFLRLESGHILPETLASGSAISIVLCASNTRTLASKEVTRDHRTPSRPLAQPLSYALLCLVILALSPLLKTLTEATTGDSIAALSTTLFLLSFTLADYSSSSKPDKEDSEERQTQLPATLSLNASLCSSIVLASRLNGPIQAFSLMLASIFLFAFLPLWFKRRRHHPSQNRRATFSLLYTAFVTLASCYSLAAFSTTAAIVNLLTVLFLSIVCPAWMRKAQGWKQGRRGPWDVGVPKFRST